MGKRRDFRGAAVAWLKDYAASAGVKMQVYRARPTSIFAPSGFVDSFATGGFDRDTALTRQQPQVNVIVLFGKFDDGDTVDQADDFMDGIIAWAETRYHQAGPNTMFAIIDYEDLPNYVPEWMPPAQQVVYYAVRLTLQGLAGVA